MDIGYFKIILLIVVFEVVCIYKIEVLEREEVWQVGVGIFFFGWCRKNGTRNSRRLGWEWNNNMNVKNNRLKNNNIEKLKKCLKY